ncbi:unnamed protein product, partial [Symbiodinium sp. CCMP2456]
MLGDPLLPSLETGDRFDIVVQVICQDLAGVSFRTLWHSELCRCAGSTVGSFEQGQVLTLYGVQYQGQYGTSHHLKLLSDTVVVPKPDMVGDSFRNFKEVCAGIGGMTAGCTLLGGTSLAVLERCPLACATLRERHAAVIEGDIADKQARQQLHLVRATEGCILGAGLPGPGLRRGLEGGFSVQGCPLLCHVLQAAWHMQASGVILECELNLLHNQHNALWLQQFMAKAGFSSAQVSLDLSQQWSTRRVRWWLVLLPAHLPALQLPVWPQLPEQRVVGDIIPVWPQWADDVEHDLQWDEKEREAFSDPDLGPTSRVLVSTQPCPTALHSWGNVFRPCPCGCRPQAFPKEVLLSIGLRGVGVPSAKDGAIRHLHPQEAGLLNGLLPCHPLPAEPRAALCLVGQLTSPMQALWVHAHIWDWAAAVFSGPPGLPLTALGRYQTQLLDARQDHWTTPAILQGGLIALQKGEDQTLVPVKGPTTAGELLQHAKESSMPGLRFALKQEGRALPHTAWLHPQPHGPTYHLEVQSKRARRSEGSEAPVPSDVATQPSPRLAADFITPPRRAATSRGSPPASVAPIPAGLPELTAGTLPLATHLASASTVACSDIALWCGLWETAQACARTSVFILPPKIATTLLEIPARALESLKLNSTQLLPETMLILAPFVSQGHWTLLVLSPCAEGMRGEVFDGIPQRNASPARCLATILCSLAGKELTSLTETTIWLQTDEYNCGAIALAHAAYRLSGAGLSDRLDTVLQFIADFPPFPATLFGYGGLAQDQEQALLQLLVAKGVPQTAAPSRLQQALAKIGSGPLAAALSHRNPWQALKAAGSKPGISFKWVQPDELEAHILSRAQEKFGTTVPQAKAKKQKPVRRPVQAPIHVDPLQLQLAPGSFTSQSGSPLGQLSFQEVQSQATGICFVTLAQASPFLQESRNLSVDALALVTTAEIAPEDTGIARVTSLRFPAIYAPTQEAILIAGSLVQLGDEDAQLAATDIAEVEHLSTVVCRLSLYRDECKLPWEQLVDAPIRALLQKVPEFQVCRERSCDQSCPAFHAAVDEVVDHLFLDVWARQWCRLSGSKTKASEADVFQAFVRVPSSAVPHLFRVALPGLYIEPRAADGSGPHSAWAVVWLPGQTLAQALHALRTNAKAVALTRLGTKYGLRTKEADEQAVFEALRPQHQFVKVRIVARYRLHPLPHGFQRHNLVQLLKQWGWSCRPLQPDRGDATGCAWLVGASGEPPAQAMPIGTNYVLVTKVRDVGPARSLPSAICASNRTKKALLIDDDQDEASSADPWTGGRDPWSQSRATSSAPPGQASSSSEATTKLSQIEIDLKQNLQQMLDRTLEARDAAGPPPGLSDHDKRLHSLETSVNELRHQGTKFESWFQSFGTQVNDQAQQLTALQGTVQEQQVALGRVQTEVQHTVQTAVGSLQSELTHQMAAQLAGQMEQITELFAAKKASHTTSFETFRYGEADHPGPSPAPPFSISTSNPTGLRAKEPHFMAWGPGIHCFSETQLSAVTLPACRQQFRLCAREANRDVRVLSGAPAPLRLNSQWAGSWSGVLQASDLPCRSQSLCWPSGLYESGRVMLAQHYHESTPLSVATVYGYPQGPTWPNARPQTDALLSVLTREVVLGSHGFRVICGDFNHDLDSLQQCALWRAQGWIETQDLALRSWNQQPVPTCKNATRRDFLWLSPEAASLCTSVTPVEVFQEHTTVLAGFSFPSQATVRTLWPLPAEMPWQDVQLDDWHQNGAHRPVTAATSDQWYARFATAVEQSLDGFVPAFPNGEASLRHDGLGAEVRRWFQQLRRLQSLWHAAKAANPAASALEYRLALWTSIRQARGFRNGFPDWWLTRPVKLVGSPASMPDLVPDASVARQLYDDFRCNFRRLEDWHLRRRTQVLDAKYDKSLAQVYKDLRDPAPEQVDSLQVRREYAILAVAPHGNQVHVEYPLDSRGVSSWAIDGDPVRVNSCDDDVCTLAAPARSDCAELEQVQTLSSVADLCSEFKSLWAPRWQLHSTKTASDWDRFLNFVRAFLPRHRLALPEISPDTWNRAVRRFKPRAARGPDGWARLDLLNLPPQRTCELLRFLAEIEASEREWPTQLVVGFVCLLCKGNGRTDAQGFRPICLYSIIYRTWAGIRARQLLAALRSLLPSGLLGFIPGHESGESLAGLSTDIRKCFNHLPREPLLSMAEQVGFPSGLLGAWLPAVAVAMVLADWAFHVYMAAFAAPAKALSFVDNLSCLASTPSQLAHAYGVLTCFTDMLCLPLDTEKTFAWAIEARDRVALRLLGHPVIDAARELGGIQSRAPGHLKLLMLPAKMWARALHGIAGCPLSEAQLNQLRSAATTALRIRPGGVSSQLRLSIASPPTADPGFYQLWTCARDLRRMAQKLPNFLASWRQYMNAHDGRALHGPFTKLVAVLGQISWSIGQPPLVIDHEGLSHNLVAMPSALLYRLLVHAWLQYVARCHTHRKQMADLNGLDPALLQADAKQLTALDTARYASVRAGAFLFGHQHSHYDLTQTGCCESCGVPDTVEHRIRYCPVYSHIRQPYQWAVDRWDSLPKALTHHLLPSANPYLPTLRRCLHELADTTGVFFCSGFGLGWQHLFTDGACRGHLHGDFALAGWGLVHARQSTAIACGLLPGVLQTAPRAELCAMTSAARWALHTGLPCVVWTDAQNVATGIEQLQAGRPLDDDADADLWQVLDGLVAQLDPARFMVRHTPSHLDARLTEAPFEDWLAAGNGHADLLAGIANNNRPQRMVEAFEAACAYHNDQLQLLRALRSIFFGIADRGTVRGTQALAADDDMWEPTVPTPCSRPRSLEIEDMLPLNWCSRLVEVRCGLPLDFVKELCVFLFEQDAASDVAYELSWLEVVFALHLEDRVQYPVCGTDGFW